MAWKKLAKAFQKVSAPPGGKTSSAAQSNLQPGPTEWHTHGPELEGEDGQGGVMREGVIRFTGAGGVFSMDR